MFKMFIFSSVVNSKLSGLSVPLLHMKPGNECKYVLTKLLTIPFFVLEISSKTSVSKTN